MLPFVNFPLMDSGGALNEPTDIAIDPSRAFTIRRFPPIQTDLASAPSLPRYSLAQRQLLVLRSVVVALQVLTVTLLLTSKHYSGRQVAVVVAVLIGLLAVVEGGIVAAAATKTRRKAALNGDESRSWQWQECLFLGPYDDETGAVGSRTMYAIYERQRRAPLVTLMLIDQGFGWTSPAFVRATGGRSLVSRLANVDHVDVIAGSAPNSWWTAMRRKDGWRSGQLRIVMKDGRQALFTGVRVDHLVDRLQPQGGQVVDGALASPADARPDRRR